MSYIDSIGTQLTSSELAVIVSLTSLGITPTNQAVNKITSTTFGNAAVGASSWTVSEQITLAGDRKTFTLLNAPSAVIYLFGGHQPQIWGVDFTGTINGSNKTFVYVAAQDPSLLTDQYATYQ